MRGQRVADFVNGLDQCVAEFLVLKIRPHSFDNALPEQDLRDLQGDLPTGLGGHASEM